MTRDSALVAFGSFARGDSDSLSDRDILIVSDDAKVRSSLRFRLERQGWSCIPYSWKRLAALAEAGSLFAHHLRLESRPIIDPQNRYAECVQGSIIRSRYNDSAEAARTLFRLLSFVPSDPIGLHWAADVMAVAIRSVLVAHFADSGEFLFDQQSLAREAQRHGLLKSSGYEVLADLRRAKRQFRNGDFTRFQERDFQNWVRELTGVIAADPPLSRVPSHLIFGEIMSSQSGAEWYYISRLVEALALTSTPHPRWIHEHTTVRQELLIRARAPTDYGWWFNGQLDEVRALVSEIANLSTMR